MKTLIHIHKYSGETCGNEHQSPEDAFWCRKNPHWEMWDLMIKEGDETRLPTPVDIKLIQGR